MPRELRPACRLKPGQTSADCPAGSAGDNGGRADIGDLLGTPQGREAYFAALAQRYEAEARGVPVSKYTASFRAAIQPLLSEIDRRRQASRTDTAMKHSDCTCGGRRDADSNSTSAPTDMQNGGYNGDPDADSELATRSALGETNYPTAWKGVPDDRLGVLDLLNSFGSIEFADSQEKCDAFNALVQKLRSFGADQAADAFVKTWPGRLDHDVDVDEQVAVNRARLRTAGIEVDHVDAASVEPSIADSEEVAASKARLRHADLWARRNRWSKR